VSELGRNSQVVTSFGYLIGLWDDTQKFSADNQDSVTITAQKDSKKWSSSWSQAKSSTVQGKVMYVQANPVTKTHNFIWKPDMEAWSTVADNFRGVEAFPVIVTRARR
jgi:hypothetical protein